MKKKTEPTWRQLFQVTGLFVIFGAALVLGMSAMQFLLQAVVYYLQNAFN